MEAEKEMIDEQMEEFKFDKLKIALQKVEMKQVATSPIKPQL